MKKLLWDYIEENITKTHKPFIEEDRISYKQIIENGHEMYYHIIIDKERFYYADLSDVLVWIYSKTID